MARKDRFPNMRKVLAGIACLFLLISALALLSLAIPQNEDPLRVIKNKGTAGMKLRDGKEIVVQNEKIYVRMGKTLRPLLPDRPQFILRDNKSQIRDEQILRLTQEAAQIKFPGLFNQSYRVHSYIALKNQRGNEKVVLCRLIFEHKNIWLAEERRMELKIAQSGQSVKLLDTAVLAEEQVIAPRTKAPLKPAVEKTPSVRPPAQARKQNVQLNTAAIQKVAGQYQVYTFVPIYDLIKDLGLTFVPVGPSAKGLANTAYPEVVTAEDATDQVHILMQTAFGSAAKLIGPSESSKSAVLDYLRNDDNLVAWNNIGHGGPSTLFQNGTQIDAADLSPSSSTFKGLSGCVCLVNSCQTFNDPLKAAILTHSPRTYIAGVVNLPMVTSEGSNPNFWYKVLFQSKTISVAYTETNNESGLNGYWGLWGYGGLF